MTAEYERIQQRDMANELARLRAEVERLTREYDGRTKTCREVEEIAGRALGYPRFCDDQTNFPGATDADGVCIGDHVTETIVEELANRVRMLTKEAHVLRIETAMALGEAGAEVERLRDALDNVEAQIVEDIVPGWVSIPAVEWDAIRAALRGAEIPGAHCATALRRSTVCDP